MSYRKYKLPCSKCGSSDAVTFYYEDSHAHCYSCGYHYKPDEYSEDFESKESLINKNIHLTPIDETRITELVDRGISLETAKKYKVFKSPDPFYSTVSPLFNDRGEHVANKLRLAGERKGFAIEGEYNKAVLFGQNLFPPGSARAITICEGYEDSMAAFELTGSKYPCVSVHSAQSARKDCANSYEYLNSFEEIVVCFDRDEAKIQPDGTKRYPGQEAALEVAQLFPPKKVRILTLQHYKDANDYLKNGLRKEFVNEWYNAQVYTPDGLRLGSDLWDEIRTRKSTESVEYPWNALNSLTYGMRMGELVTFTADTGSGKSTLLREIVHHVLKTTDYSVGLMFLEETNAETAIGLMSVQANKPLHLPDVRDSVSEEELRKYYDETVGNDRLVFYDHFGSNAIDDLLSKVRHMAALGAKFIILDHLSIVVSDQSGDERKQLDEITTKLKTLTVELQICVLAVVHQNRQGQIRGTAGVEQLSNIVVKLFRDKEEEDPFRRNVTKLLVQKNRFSGRTGPGGYLFYDAESGRLQELDEVGVQQYENGGSDNPTDPFTSRDGW